MNITTVYFSHLSLREIRIFIIPQIETQMSGEYVFNWPRPTITCSNTEDAMFLILMFGGKIIDDKIKCMIDSNDIQDEI